jgi:hypothetical protein
LCGVVVKITGIGGTKFVVVPGLIIMGVDKREVLCIGKNPSTGRVINPSVDERGFRNLDRFF